MSKENHVMHPVVAGLALRVPNTRVQTFFCLDSTTILKHKIYAA